MHSRCPDPVSRPAGIRIGIIGAGFSGSLLAVHLLRRAVPGIELVLIERHGAPGRGLAYSTQNPRHLLNVRVANMSAFPDDASHFLRWLWARDWSPSASIPPSGHAFVPRWIYGAYIEETFQEAVAARSGEIPVGIVEGDAVDLIPGRPLQLILADGRVVPLDIAILCVGNFPPEAPACAQGKVGRSPHFIRDPWDSGRIAAIPPEDTVAIIGSGLTTVDVVQSLEQAGHHGQIEIVSRHGLLPQRHEETRSYPGFVDPTDPPRTALAAMRLIRAEVRRGKAQGYGWQSVFDTLRPHIGLLWQALPLAERSRFLRHPRAYWEIHRHRMAPEPAERIEKLRQAARLRIHAARIEAIQTTPLGFELALRRRGGGKDRLACHWVINCGGPQCDYLDITDPLVRNLRKRGLLRPDPLGLGIEVTGERRLVDAEGTADGELFALGPPTKGTFWEITAVPDIRTACVELAECIASEAAARVEGALVAAP